MRIQNIQLTNFKRFTDLTLQGIPKNAKLVLLIGSNGSGKSCVFDGFEVVSGKYLQTPIQGNVGGGNFIVAGSSEYHQKKLQPSFININFHNGDNVTAKCLLRNEKWEFSGLKKDNLFYGRSAFRYLPKITKTSIGQVINVEKDEDRPQLYINNDNRFNNDIDLLIKEVVEKVFKGINTDSAEQLDEIKAFLEKINKAFPNIFGQGNGTKLTFKRFEPPAEGRPARLIFEKGASEIDYDLLSGGEKEVVNLLFNLFVRNRFYNDTIYFMDEIDSHLNTKLQYNLLKEITENWIPGQSQLWTASHSLGFIQYAKENDNAVIFDFDDYDFDYPKILQPEPKDKSDIYEIAVSKEILPELFKNYQIFFVENEDRKYYASLNIHDTIFVSEKNRDAVFHKARTNNFKGIVDRDFLTDEDIELLNKQYPNVKILKFYCVENFLYHPDNMEEYCVTNNILFDKEKYINEIVEEKEKAKKSIVVKIATIRQTYPYFKEPGMEKSPHKKRFTPDTENHNQSESIVDCLNNDEFDVYYKIFSMKEYCKELPQRQNISPVELSKTSWFKTQIELLISDKGIN